MVRVFFIIIWGLFIIVFTCTSNLEAFLITKRPHFEATMNINLLDMGEPFPRNEGYMFYLRKVGHMIAFFIFTLLLSLRFSTKRLVLGISLLFAVFTEILQLFFMRDGRLFDVGFDSFGIVAALLILYVTQKMILSFREVPK